MDIFYEMDGREIALRRKTMMGNVETLFAGPEVAIAFDAESMVMHKHGSPEKVGKWIVEARRKYIDAGFPEMAGNLMLIQGAFPVDDLNRCMESSGYFEVMMERMRAEASAIEHRP